MLLQVRSPDQSTYITHISTEKKNVWFILKIPTMGKCILYLKAKSKQTLLRGYSLAGTCETLYMHFLAYYPSWPYLVMGFCCHFPITTGKLRGREAENLGEKQGITKHRLHKLDFHLFHLVYFVTISITTNKPPWLVIFVFLSFWNILFWSLIFLRLERCKPLV